MLITDLFELKSVLEIDPANTDEDKKLWFFIEQATSVIETYLNRPGLSYAERTEFYNGTNTNKLLLKSRPVFLTPQVWVDAGGYYGSVSGSFDSTTALTYGEDFCLSLDQDTTSSRSGILLRIKGIWERPSVRQFGYLSPFIGEGRGSIKVTYTAGYTVDTLPAEFRLACDLLVSKLRWMFPLGIALNSENYEDRSISLTSDQKTYLTNEIKPILHNYRNWKF